MNKLIAIVVTTVLIIGCQSQEEKDNSIVINKCISELKSELKDPDSMKLTSEPSVYISHVPAYNNKKMVSLHYNVKNSYGGYVGNETFYCSFNDDGTIYKTNH